MKDACATFEGDAGQREGIRRFKNYLAKYGKVITTKKATELLTVAS